MLLVCVYARRRSRKYRADESLYGLHRLLARGAARARIAPTFVCKAREATSDHPWLHLLQYRPLPRLRLATFMSGYVGGVAEKHPNRRSPMLVLFRIVRNIGLEPLTAGQPRYCPCTIDCVD